MTVVAVVLSALGIFVAAVSSQSLSQRSVKYVSGPLFAQQSEIISAQIINGDSSNSHNYQVVIYQYNGSNPGSSVANTGTVSLAASTRGGGNYTVPSGVADYFSVEVTSSDPSLVSVISIMPACSSVPCTTPRLNLTQLDLVKFTKDF
jgi:hypothetical protein